MKLFSQATSRILFFLLLLIVLLVPAVQTQAQTVEDGGLSMTIRPGFDGIVKEDSWFPLLITLANDGPAVEGELTISVSDNGLVWRQEVSLPTQSRKQIQTVVYVPEYANRLRIVLSDENGKALLKSVASSGSLQMLDSQKGLMYGIVSPEPDTLGLLSGVNGGRTDVGVGYLSIEEIPVDPIALDGLDVLIFSDVDTNELSSAQREAIDIWVGGGGQLVLTGGAGWQKTTAAFQEQLPVDVSGTASVERLDGFESAVGINFRDAGPYVIAQSSLKNGELIWRNEAQPILARRAIGDGGVWFLALDPQFAPLDDWDGSPIVWNSVVEFVPRPYFWQRGFVEPSNLIDSASTIPAIKLPSVWLILGFMLLYVLIAGPLNYIVLNRMQRRELAWLTLPATMLLFSGVAFVVGLQFRGNRVILNQISLVYGRFDAPELRVDSGVGIYSPRRDEFNIVLEPDAHVRSIDRYGGYGFAAGQEISLGSENVLEDVLVSVGDVTPFVSSRYQDASPISASVTLSADGKVVEVVVTNISQQTLYNSVLLIGSKMVQVADLAAGETFEKEIDIPFDYQESFALEAAGGPKTYRVYPAIVDGYKDHPLETGLSTLIEGEPVGGLGGYQYYYGEPDKQQRASLFNSLYKQYNGENVYMPEGRVIFIGWSDTAQFDIAVGNNSFDLESSSLYFLEIPVEQ